MAHFAELDKDNKVIRVIVIDNNDMSDENGIEKEELGINFCKSLFGEDTNWVQTSYNGNFRNRFASVGNTYDATLDAFLNPKPFPSWVLDENLNWQAPKIRPAYQEGFEIKWNEEKLDYDITPVEEPTNV